MSAEPHDQTRGDSTPFFKDANAAHLSRNEVAALCMKAARGAGMSWGMAEEAGFAAAWLVTHGIDGPEHLCAHLQEAQGREWPQLCPKVTPGNWRSATGSPLCPIVLGATLCDYAAQPEGPVAECSIGLGAVDHPILLLPFLATIAQSNGILITLTWAEGSVCMGQDATWLAAATAALSDRDMALSLSARQGAAQAPLALSPPQVTCKTATIAALNTLAMRTTVPASEASRAGAGSSLGDND